VNCVTVILRSCTTEILWISCIDASIPLLQRAANLNKLANAWTPLYQTLTPDQKERTAFSQSSSLGGWATSLNVLRSQKRPRREEGAKYDRT
jgi:hypothetical protein